MEVPAGGVGGGHVDVFGVGGEVGVVAGGVEVFPDRCLRSTQKSPTPSQLELETWIDDFDLHSPVLGDRVWGLSVVEPALGDGYAYPTSILVRPDGTVMSWRTGFSTFEPFAEAFRAEAG